jgi:hypothetical protein
MSKHLGACDDTYPPALYRSACLCFLATCEVFDMTPCRICQLVLRSIKLSYTAAFRNPVRRTAGWNPGRRSARGGGEQDW